MYHIRQAFLAMRGNLTATISTLTTMTLTMLILGFVLLLTLNVNRTLEQLESQVEVAAFLDEDADKNALLGQVRAYAQVMDAKLVSKDKVLEEMTRDHPYTKEAAELAGNPYPDTIRMRVSRIEDSKLVGGAVKALPGVESVEYGDRYVDTAVSTLTAIRTAGYTLVGVLLIGTLFSILNAVRVAMFARRNEISVMRLLGATRSFIRMPHLIEGVLVGLVASAFASGILWFGYAELAKRMASLEFIFPLVTDWNTILQILGGVALLGIGTGFFGSLFASRRYLRELQ